MSFVKQTDAVSITNATISYSENEYEGVKIAIDQLLAKGYEEVCAGAFPENHASMRVMEKAGMTKIDKTEDVEYRGNVYHCIFYDMSMSAVRDKVSRAINNDELDHIFDTDGFFM